MAIIDASLIEKYINGEAIEGKNIEDLENDKTFMISVINHTNDYKMYYLCSESLKRTYEFIIFLISKFKDEKSFIQEIADYFLEHNDNDIENMELSIIMEKEFAKSTINKYEIKNSTKYSVDRLEVELAKAQNKEIEAKIGMGFILFFDQYNSSKIILDYYAKSLINEIVAQKIDFEEMLHQRFKTPEELLKCGIKNYIINFISCYDKELSSYIITHFYLIKDLENQINNIVDQWNSYGIRKDKKIRNRYKRMFVMVHEYFEYTDSSLVENSLIYYIARELGIFEELKKHDELYVDELLDLDCDYEFEDDMMRCDIESNIYETKVYQNVKKIMINQLFAEEPSSLETLIPEKKAKSSSPVYCKVIDFPNKMKVERENTEEE